MQITQKTDEWGNSTGIRLPRKVLKAAKWKEGQEVKIDVRGQTVVLTPIKDDKDDFTLEDMLKGVTPENVHPEVDWGPDVGAEIIDDDYS